MDAGFLNSAVYLGLVVVAFGAGAWWYRYTLKRNPSKIEALAAEAKKIGDRFR